ncbi:NADPH:quinone oxidoreductase family protein [Parasulfitobacter algicola]|uniref:NADPH:quinone oxidoreductase family protein n=1 Tax=Parasulfitobacter algicola TaxID=2614809 RepID=A0ABX2IUC6_9RHOB|nr:NADPH:quinone oxidoreductase family protein [Sulfitobacter algicola]NSX56508.1 NADPH:quinone oxidoreductase family protein [Sulfitobacter algicola]
MRAFQVNELGKNPQLADVLIPEPKEGEVRVKIHACGLNFADLLLVKGEYQEKPLLPFTLGIEVAGLVEACGPGVKHPAIGSRIAVLGNSGGLAEAGIFPAERCLPIPDAMPFTDAAAFQVAYGTSHLALTQRAMLKKGDTLLVLGAAGGVGLTAVEIGKALGATVIACARGDDKLAAAKSAGADHLIDSETADITREVKALGGADVVYDPVGGDQFTAALRACNRGARMLVIGFASGDVPPIPANILLVKNISVIGFYWGGYMALNPKALMDSLVELMAWYSKGDLHPHISNILPLEHAADALELLRSRKSTGKVVVTP